MSSNKRSREIANQKQEDDSSDVEMQEEEEVIVEEEEEVSEHEPMEEEEENGSEQDSSQSNKKRKTEKIVPFKAPYYVVYSTQEAYEKHRLVEDQYSEKRTAIESKIREVKARQEQEYTPLKEKLAAMEEAAGRVVGDIHWTPTDEIKAFNDKTLEMVFAHTEVIRKMEEDVKPQIELIDAERAEHYKKAKENEERDWLKTLNALKAKRGAEITQEEIAAARYNWEIKNNRVPVPFEISLLFTNLFGSTWEVLELDPFLPDFNKEKAPAFYKDDDDNAQAKAAKAEIEEMRRVNAEHDAKVRKASGLPPNSPKSKEAEQNGGSTKGEEDAEEPEKPKKQETEAEAKKREQAEIELKKKALAMDYLKYQEVKQLSTLEHNTETMLERLGVDEFNTVKFPEPICLQNIDLKSLNLIVKHLTHVIKKNYTQELVEKLQVCPYVEGPNTVKFDEWEEDLLSYGNCKNDEEKKDHDSDVFDLITAADFLGVHRTKKLCLRAISLQVAAQKTVLDMQRRFDIVDDFTPDLRRQRDAIIASLNQQPAPRTVTVVKG